jgi:hypothetical protein
MEAQSPRAKMEGCVAVRVPFSVSVGEEEEEDCGMSWIRRCVSVTMEPVLGCFWTFHFVGCGVQEVDGGEEEEEVFERMRSAGASRTWSRAEATKGFCIRPVPVHGD